jgi:hypothetical protein
MNCSYPTRKVFASAEYVLSVIRDNHRQQCQFDPEADPRAVLTFDSTVADWRYACDLLRWRKLAESLNEYWNIKCSLGQWRAVLEPPKQRTLRDVCNLIASHAVCEVVRPAWFLGAPCETAGAFLTVRSLLQDAGADAALIAPSAALAPFARRYAYVFMGPISRLAPNRLPPVKIHKPAYRAAVVGLLASWLLIVCGSYWDAGLTIIGVLAVAFCYVVLFVAAKSNPAAVEFGNLRTFRDLAVAMSGPAAEA